MSPGARTTTSSGSARREPTTPSAAAGKASNRTPRQVVPGHELALLPCQAVPASHRAGPPLLRRPGPAPDAGAVLRLLRPPRRAPAGQALPGAVLARDRRDPPVVPV